MFLKIGILLGVILLSGCATYKSKVISNDEIIKETKKCEEAGMKAQLLVDGLNNKPKMIICEPNN